MEQLADHAQKGQLYIVESLVQKEWQETQEE